MRKVLYDKLNIYGRNIKIRISRNTMEMGGGINYYMERFIKQIPFSRFKYEIVYKAEFEKFGNKSFFFI